MDARKTVEAETIEANASEPGEADADETMRPTSQGARTRKTKERILEAAHAAFVAGGFDGTSIEAIAAASGVNKSLIYRHYSNKDELFTVVLENAYERMRVAEKRLNLERCEPVEAIVALIRFNWTYYNDNTDFLALVSSENLCGGRHLQGSTRVPAQSSQLTAMVEGIVVRGQRTGLFRPGINAIQLWISISAMSWFYCANRHTIAATFGAELLSHASRDERLQHIIDMILRDLTSLGTGVASSTASPARTARRLA